MQSLLCLFILQNDPYIRLICACHRRTLFFAAALGTNLSQTEKPFATRFDRFVKHDRAAALSTRFRSLLSSEVLV